MIATMTVNQPTKEDNARTTLIIVPAALLLQWKEELLTKTNEIFSVHIHHGKDKLKTVDEVRKWDVCSEPIYDIMSNIWHAFGKVIITTYHTLIMDFVGPEDGEEPDDFYRWLSVNG